MKKKKCETFHERFFSFVDKNVIGAPCTDGGLWVKLRFSLFDFIGHDQIRKTKINTSKH